MSSPENRAYSNPDETPAASEALAEQCEFCLIPETKGTALFRQMYGVDQILQFPGLSASYTTMQDIVPVAEQGAHVLLMPNKIGTGHYISLSLENDQDELTKARDAVVSTLQTAFPRKPIFTFEHGPGFIDEEPIACGGCHLDHAHGHLLVLPEQANMQEIQTGMESQLHRSGWNDVASRRMPSGEIFTNLYEKVGINPYLQIGMIKPDGSQESFTYRQNSSSEDVESQLLRRVIAETVYGQKNPSFWHWRDITSGFSSLQRVDQLKADVIAFRKVTST